MDALELWLGQLYRLRVDVSSGHEKPHKPALLLAILDLVEAGAVAVNRIPFGPELRRRFDAYFDVVRQGNDKSAIDLPFFHLQSDKLWTVQTHRGPLDARATMAQLTEWEAAGSFNEELWSLMRSATGREQLRDGIISRYFPDHRPQLLGISGLADTATAPEDDDAAESRVGRSAAFRAAIIEIYDYQCAACGLRLRLPDSNVTFVDAAHLIPFGVSRNDHPTNGLALCKNHHWALDRHLIAPTPELVWLASPRLDRRRSSGEEQLAELEGKPLLEPHNRDYPPAPASLQWRVERLLR